MRVGFKVTKGSTPIKNASIIGNLITPILITDSNGEVFSIAPMFISLAKYLLDVTITCRKGESIHLLDIANEISNYYKVDLNTKMWGKETLSPRIAGDGFNKIDPTPLNQSELIISKTDPMLTISNCGICLYYDRIMSTCIVNGKLTLPIPIKNPLITTSRLYYPVFLPPSEERLKRDTQRLQNDI